MKTAVVVGALGVVGRYIVERLAASPEWNVIGLSRRRAPSRERVRHGARPAAVLPGYGVALALPGHRVAPLRRSRAGCDWDVMSNVTKSRLHGFHAVVDSEEMFVRLLRRFRQERIVP